MLAAQFGTGQVFLSMLYFFLFFIWLEKTFEHELGVRRHL